MLRGLSFDFWNTLYAQGPETHRHALRVERLTREALLDCFQSTIFSDEAGFSKPHISLFQKTARNLRVAPENLLHTGDLEHTDLLGAQNAGCRSVKFIGVTTSDPAATRADRVIGSYDRFRDTITEIFNE